MNPLVLQVERAHTEINQMMELYNQQIRLPSLPEVIGAEGSSSVSAAGACVCVCVCVRALMCVCCEFVLHCTPAPPQPHPPPPLPTPHTPHLRPDLPARHQVVDLESMLRYVQQFCQALSSQAGHMQNCMALAKVDTRT
jgi:hypothetical protein